MNVDKINLKLTRVYPMEISTKMELGQEVEIRIKGSVVQEIVGDNQDGSVNLTYVVKPLVTEIQ